MSTDFQYDVDRQAQPRSAPLLPVEQTVLTHAGADVYVKDNVDKKKEPPRGQLTTWSAVKDFIFAGKAVFTIRSVKTGLRLTYKVTVKKEDVAADLEDVAYFVNLLRGPDNTKDFAYLGVLRKPGNFFITTASKITRHPTSYKALVWFLDALRCERDVLGKQLEFWHNGHCGQCGRLLTVPESVQRGLGPECARGVR